MSCNVKVQALYLSSTQPTFIFGTEIDKNVYYVGSIVPILKNLYNQEHLLTCKRILYTLRKQ